MVRFSLFSFLLRPAVLGASLALTVAIAPARAERPTNFGPVGPNEPILAKIGDLKSQSRVRISPAVICLALQHRFVTALHY